MKGNSNIMFPVHIKLPGGWEMLSSWAAKHNCNSTFTEKQHIPWWTSHGLFRIHQKSQLAIGMRQTYGYYFLLHIDNSCSGVPISFKWLIINSKVRLPRCKSSALTGCKCLDQWRLFIGSLFLPSASWEWQLNILPPGSCWDLKERLETCCSRKSGAQ